MRERCEVLKLGGSVRLLAARLKEFADKYERDYECLEAEQSEGVLVITGIRKRKAWVIRRKQGWLVLCNPKGMAREAVDRSKAHRCLRAVLFAMPNNTLTEEKAEIPEDHDLAFVCELVWKFSDASEWCSGY